MVQGIFPFSVAEEDDDYYQLIIEGRLDEYWHKIGGEALSEEFKDLIIRMLSYDPACRPTIEELQSHPWLQTPLAMEIAKEATMATLREANYIKPITNYNSALIDTKSSFDGKSTVGDRSSTNTDGIKLQIDDLAWL